MRRRFHPPIDGVLLLAIVFLVIVGMRCGQRLETKSDQMDTTGQHRTEDSTVLEAARSLPQSMVRLEFHRRPNSRANVDAASSNVEPFDADSIELTEYRGKLHYQPVNLCHRILCFLATYKHTGNERFLERAHKFTMKLIELSHREGSALYVPYSMDFAVHGDSATFLSAPWYSGMAQGEFLSVLSRLYEFTGNQEYRAFADSVFQSLLVLQGQSSKWVVRLDDNGFYWIEEYPHHRNPGRTLNGYVAAVYGIYDYYLVTGDQRARRVYDLSLTTLKHYLPFYLREENSCYDLSHEHPANKTYHNLHISMMYHMQRISGDPFFGIMAAAFERSSTFD